MKQKTCKRSREKMRGEIKEMKKEKGEEIQTRYGTEEKMVRKLEME